jgi:hypothetical protein
MKLTRLSSGYWLASWGPNLWIQWPVGSHPSIADGFGWVTASHLRQAECVAALAEDAMRQA